MLFSIRKLFLRSFPIQNVCTSCHNRYVRQLFCNNFAAKPINLFAFEQVRYAGHSKWSNIKHKKMHKDNARASLFGKLSLEIIQSVKDNGADPAFNSRLESLMLKAKACSMPKDKIETSIKNALRSTDAKRTRVVIQARGPGKCGLLVDILSPNIVRTNNEIRGILKKNDITFIEDGSVAFLFDHKGVVTAVNNLTETESENIEEQAEEIAIIIGAEDVMLLEIEDESVLQFICLPLDIINVKKQLHEEYKDLTILSADAQYLAKTLVNIPDGLITQADQIIESLMEHPDVLQVYDNMIGYPSKTIKLTNQYEEFR